jgi:hypothetical protein
MNDAKNHDSQQEPDSNDAKTNARRQAETSMQAYLQSGGQRNQYEISLAELWLKTKSIIAYLWMFKFLIIGVGLLFALGGYFKVKMKPSFKASLTFALEQGDASGGLGSLASQFGLSIGGSAGSGLGGDNLLGLMKSPAIIERVLKIQPHGSKVLIDQYVETNPKLKARWAERNLLPYACCSPARDSALNWIIDELLLNELTVAKTDKKQSFVTITFTGHDEVFTKNFVEVLTQEATEFYVQTKMANANKNISNLQWRVDSVRAELRKALVGAGAAQDQLFLVGSSAKTTSIEKQMTLTTLSTLYGELVKNLELSRTLASREEPLITIIDLPRYPLREHDAAFKASLIGGFLGVLTSIITLLLRGFIRRLNQAT